jgi:hypothetical protein
MQPESAPVVRIYAEEMQPESAPVVRIYAEEMHRSDYAESGGVPAAREATHPPADFDFLLPPEYPESPTSVVGILCTEEAIGVF